MVKVNGNNRNHHRPRRMTPVTAVFLLRSIISVITILSLVQVMVPTSLAFTTTTMCRRPSVLGSSTRFSNNNKVMKTPIPSMTRRNRSSLLASSSSSEEISNLDQVEDEALVVVADENEITDDRTSSSSSSTTTTTTLTENVISSDSVTIRMEEIDNDDEDEDDDESLSSPFFFPTPNTTIIPRSNNDENLSPTTESSSTSTSSSSSTLGAALLVAGTTVGAGVLALPSATISSGFIPSSFALTVSWLYMTASGLLIAELVLTNMIQTGQVGNGLLHLYQDILGGNNNNKVGGDNGDVESALNGNIGGDNNNSIVGSSSISPLATVASGAYFFLHYVVMIAYVAQGGINLNGFLESSSILPSGLGHTIVENINGQFLFSSLCALVLYSTSNSFIEKLNNVLVVGVITAFFAIVGVASTTTDITALLSPTNQHPTQVMNALPILFLSMVYHNIVPTIVNQLQGDRQKIQTAIVGGTAIPFIMFLTWNGVMLGNLLSSGVPPETYSSIDPVRYLQSNTAGENGILLSTLVTSFSQLAIVTSLIGFVYGLLDALTDVFHLPMEGEQFRKFKPALFAAVFIPPTVLSLNPGIFYNALDYGGAYGVSTLFLLLPAIMVWNVRYDNQQTAIPPLVPFGKVLLGSMSAIAATLILGQVSEQIGLF